MHGMMPTQQRFETIRPACLEVDDRLKIKFEFVVGNRPLQIDFDLLVLEQPLFHLRIEHDDAVAPLGLGLVERDVGMTQQLVR